MKLNKFWKNVMIDSEIWALKYFFTTQVNSEESVKQVAFPKIYCKIYQNLQQNLKYIVTHVSTITIKFKVPAIKVLNSISQNNISQFFIFFGENKHIISLLNTCQDALCCQGFVYFTMANKIYLIKFYSAHKSTVFTIFYLIIWYEISFIAFSL